MTDTEFRDYYAKTRHTLTAMREHVEGLDIAVANSSAMRTLVLTLIGIVQTLLWRVEFMETRCADLVRRCDHLERQQKSWLQ